MPESAIGKEIKSPVTLSALAPLKARWRVSIQALIRRAKDLSLITARQYRYLFEQLSYMGWRTKEPIEIENEKPRALRQMAEMIYGEPIDFERMAHESAIKAHELREIIGGYMPRVDQTPKFDSKVVTLPRQKR
jgi:Zn-dependent peptidase ImmA (M78 family)